MTKEQLIETMKNDKKFFKKVANEKGLMGMLWNNYKHFLAASNHQVHEMTVLMHYKPGQEGQDEGFGEYGVMAIPLNEQGQQEQDAVKTQLKEKGLLEDIGNIRFEAVGTGYGQFDIPEFKLEDESYGQIKRHSTKNLLICTIAIGESAGQFENYTQCLLANDPEGKRWFMPFSAEFLKG
ncbi:MAG: hypothetical protein MI717_09715 [Spirochaetales bacterium]|nr:hypothetical protein [Spirochaetales bacterium]